VQFITFYVPNPFYRLYRLVKKMGRAQGLLALGLLFLGVVYGARLPRGADFKAINHRHADLRLPAGIKPDSYFLQLQPFLEQVKYFDHLVFSRM